MKVVRIAAIAIGGLFGLIIVAGIVVALIFDPNDYREYAQDWVEESTGRSLRIYDDIELSVFPWLAVETGRIELGNAPGFGIQPFIAAQSASARVRIIPLLLRRELEIGTVRLDGLELDLAVAADGTTNWDDLTGTGSPEEVTQTQQPSAADDADAFGGLGIEAIVLRGARIVWRENDAPRFIVSDLSLSTGTVSTTDPIEIDVAFDILEVATQRRAHLEVASVAALDSGGVLDARDTSIAYRVDGTGGATETEGNATVELLEFVPGESLHSGPVQMANTVSLPIRAGAAFPAELGWTSLDVDLTTMNVAIENLEAAANGVRARWQLVGENLAGDAALLRGSVVIEESPAAAALELAGVMLPGDIDAATLGDFSASTGFVLDLGAQSFVLDNLDLAVLGIELRAQQAALTGESLSAQLDITPFRPNAALRGLLSPYLPDGISLDGLGTIALNARIAGTPDDVAVTGMRFTGLGAQITGQVRIEQLNAGLRLTGDVATNRFAPGELLAVAGTLVPASVSATSAGELALAGQFAYDTAAGSLRLDSFRMEAFGLRGNGTLAGTGLGQSAEFAGRVQLEDFDPRALLSRFDLAVPQTSDDSALRRANVTARFEVSPTAAAFDDLAVNLDDSRMTGSFLVSNFEDPLYRFSLSADRLDVDRYLPPQAPPGSDAEPTTEPGERRAGDMELSSEALNAVNVDADVSVGELRLAGMDFSNVTTSLVVGDGRMLLDSAHADLYGGSFDGRFHVDASAAVPTMSLQGNAAGLGLTPLITALAGSASFSGTGSFDIDLRGRGQTVTDNLRSAAGTMGFELANGAIEGFNIDKTLCRAFNRVRGNQAPADQPDRTPYQVVRGTATVTDGIAASNDLYAVAGSAEVRGSGTLALADQVVDYDFEARVARPVPIAGCEEMERIVGHDFPLEMKGALTSPEITPDYSEVIRRVLEYQLRENVRERILESLFD